MKKKLLIWDFDGVIADTEKLWLKNRQTLLKEVMNIDLDWATIENLLKGMSDFTKREMLNKVGIITDDNFWIKSMEMDLHSMYTIGFTLTKDIEDIFKLNIKQCIATGGIKSKTLKKIDVVNISKYFPENKVFTADMVEKGKPEPDLFLLAAKSNNTQPEDCVIVEDSIAGLTAAISAKAIPIAYFDGIISDDNEQIQKIKSLGVKYIYNNMKDIKNKILELF